MKRTYPVKWLSLAALAVFPVALFAIPTDGLAIWLDASSNVVLNATGGVVEWADVREVPGAATHLHPSAYSYLPDPSDAYASVPPTIREGDARAPGRKFIDFGDYASGRWMYFGYSLGNRWRQSVGAIFAVVGFRTANNAGHLFGDVAALNKYQYGSGQMFFHKQYGSQAGGNIAGSDLNSNVMPLGETWLDGRRIDPRTTAWQWDRFQVFVQNGPENVVRNGVHVQPFVSTFCNQVNESGRQGGALFGEVLIYDRALTDDERREVEDYLAVRWLGKTLSHRDTGAAEAQVAIRPGVANTVDENGVVAETPASKSDEAAVTAPAGFVVTVTNAFPANVSLAVAGGRLRLADLAHFPEASTIAPDDSLAATNLIQNGDFEIPYVADATYYNAGGATGWSMVTYDRGVGTKGCPMWTGNGNVPSGRQFLVLSRYYTGTAYGAVKQTFKAPVRGRYRLGYWMTRRTSRSEGDGNSRLKVFVDGNLVHRNAVFGDHRADKDAFKYYEAELPPLTAGDHELRLALDEENSAIDRAVNLDCVRVWPVSEGEFVHIPNPDFSSSAEPCTNASYSGTAIGHFVTYPSSAEWTFHADPNKASRMAGIAQHSWWHDLNWNSRPADLTNDYRVAFLEGATSMSVPVTVPRTGRARFSMRYAVRSSWKSAGITGETGQHIEVSLGDTILADVYPVTPGMRSYVGEVDLTAGVYQLQVKNVLSSSTANQCSLVDDLCLEYVDDRPSDLVLAPSETFTTNFTVAVAGAYAMRCRLAGRPVDRAAAAGVCNSAAYYPGRASLSVDGVDVSMVCAEHSDLHEVQVRLPYLSAGNHTLVLTSNGGGDSRIRLASFGIVAADSTVPFDLSQTSLTLLDDATLWLDYPGERNVLQLRRNGIRQSGCHSAATDPAWVTGPGVLSRLPVGLMILLH